MAITYATFEDAHGSIPDEDRDTYMVCGVRVSETEDAYLVLERSIPDDVAEEIFYEVRHKKTPSTYEKWLWGMARDRVEADA